MAMIKTPIGIELVKKGIITEKDIQDALEYQKQHSDKKIGDILNILHVTDSYTLIKAIGEILDERGMLFSSQDLKLSPIEYISMDIIKKSKAIPFDIAQGKIKVCFADTTDRKTMETIRLILLNKGLIVDRYITFESNINEIIKGLEKAESFEEIDKTKDASSLIDNIIKNAMEKRASDIHIEPLENEIRVRYRIDGELITVTKLEKEKQGQISGRIKAISNMFQEKQESQDGRILEYDNYNIRVSSQKNIHGEKFVLRLLKKASNVQGIFELGFPNDPEYVKKCFDKRNSITIIAAPTGEGKTTTLYSIIDFLNKPEINITTIEDPVEIRIAGLNQIEIDAKSRFSDALRTVLRQDPDIVLVGEIRDEETAQISFQAGQTGHYVLSTIHTIDAIETITRLRKLGVSNYDIASTVATTLSQRLLRKLCDECKEERAYTDEETTIITNLFKKYDEKVDLKGMHTYNAIGCPHCNNTGYYGRIAAFEVLLITDEIKQLIVDNASSIEIKKVALKGDYRPLAIGATRKVLEGYTDLAEINKKLVLY